MKTYFDTSVVIASRVDTHENHPEAFHAVTRIAQGGATGVICAHGLAECYSVITVTRACRQVVSPLEVALTLRDNTAGTFEIVALTAEDYLEVVRSASENGLTGGRIYDVLHLTAARKSHCDIIYTFNVRHFRELAPDLATRIRAPQLP